MTTLGIKVTFAVLGSLLVTVVLMLLVGSFRQNRSSSRQVDVLVQAPRGTGPSRVDFGLLEELPDPVARYLRHVLRDGQRRILVARLRQIGELRTDMEKDRWSPFEANQIIAPLAIGFVWNARVQMAPLPRVRVRDAYVRGQGSGRVSLLSAITLAAEANRPEINSGSLHRYLAEGVWYPTALLPSPALQWHSIDSTKALARLTDAGTTVSLEFWFNQAGEVTGIYSPARWGRFDGEYRQAPWEGHFRNYEGRDGMLVPSQGEVGWYSSGEWRSVWKGRIAEASYEFTR